MPNIPSTHAAGPDLAPAVQTRNLLLFAGCVGMTYLAAPVLYIGSTHAALLDQLEASSAFANSPEALYLAFAFSPVVVTSFFTHPQWLRPLLITGYLLTAAGTTLVAAAIVGDCSPRVIGWAVVAQAVITGIANTTAVSLLWEAMGRGVAEGRRGATLALAFGVGPILAAAGSLGSQALLTGESLGLRFGSAPAFPGNYALVFAAGTVPMLVAAVLASLFVLPEASPTATRDEAGGGLLGAVTGFFGDPLLRRVAIASILIYTASVIVANLTLYTREAMGELPSDRVMYQNALRFATKAVAGLLLGALLAKTHPLAGLLATGGLCMLSPLYASWATGLAYLATFQIYGAGELFGVYSPNYVLSASHRRDIRRNLACSYLLTALAAPFGVFFGWIADVVGESAGRAVGYRVSFLMCSAIIATGLLVALTLPRRPQPTGAADGLPLPAGAAEPS